MNKNQFGQELYAIAMAAMDSLQPIEGEGIRITQVNFEADVNHDDEDKILQARQVKDEWDKAGDTAAGTALAKQLGLTSVFHASAILARPGRPQRGAMEINAAYIAGFSFITAPFEMFAATITFGRSFLRCSTAFFTPLLLIPKRLMMALSCGTLKHLGFALPSCG